MSVATPVKAVIGATALILAFSASVLVANADPASPWRSAGAATRSYLGQTDVIARVDSAAITRRDLLVQQAMFTMSNALSPTKVPTDARAALDRLVSFLAVSEEAYRRGLRPTEVKVAGHIAQMRVASRGFAKAQAELDDYLAGLNMSADEYFARPETRDFTARGLAIQGLRDQILKDVAPAAQAATWEAFEKSVIAKAVINVVDPALR